MTRQGAFARCGAVLGAVLGGAMLAAPAYASGDVPGAEVFGATPGVSSVALSPDGTQVAWSDVRQELQYVVTVDVPTGKVRRMPVHKDMKLRTVQWADDETLLLEVSMAHLVRGDRPQLYEFFRVLALEPATGQSRILLMNDEARQWVTAATLVATRTTQPRTVIMSSWDHSGTSSRQSTGTRIWSERRDSGWTHDLFAVDVRTGRGRKIAAGTPYTVDWVVDAAGEPVARAEWEPARSAYSVLARLPNGAWKEIYRLGNGSTLALNGLTRDGKAIAAQGSDGTGRSRLWAIALDGSGASVIAGDPGRDVVAVQYDPYTRHPIGAWLGGLDPEVRWFDAEAQANFTKVARSFPDRKVELSGRSASGERVLARVGGPATPAVHYLVDFAARRADIVGEAYPGLENRPLGKVVATSYAARDGTPIPAYLTLPPGSGGKDLPLVVLPHGGPEARDEYDFDWFAQFLATRGYAVLQPQFRGSTGFGDEFRRAGYGQWGGVMQDDVTDGVKAMIEQGVANANRICIVGGSYGGYAALAGVTLTPDLYACAVSINGLSDLPMAIGQQKMSDGAESNSYAYWSRSIGSMHDARLAQRSPARLATNVRSPVLLLHGVQDTVVPVGQSRAMAKALQAAGKPHTYVELPGEDHWLSRTATRVRVLQETERFLAAHLGAPAAATATAAP